MWRPTVGYNCTGTQQVLLSKRLDAGGSSVSATPQPSLWGSVLHCNACMLRGMCLMSTNCTKQDLQRCMLQQQLQPCSTCTALPALTFNNVALYFADQATVNDGRRHANETGAVCHHFKDHVDGEPVL